MTQFNESRLSEFVKNMGVTYKENSRSWIFSCPRCHKHEKLYIRKTDGYFKCFKCAEINGFRGKCEFALAELAQLPIAEIRQVIYGSGSRTLRHLDIFVEKHFDDDEQEDFWTPVKRSPYEWPLLYVGYDSPFFEKGRQYLLSRGITEELIRKYDIRYSTTENRVVMPYVVDGALVGWQGRYCGKAEVTDLDTGKTVKIPKTITTVQESIVTNHVMFGDNLSTVDHCVLAEGPFDALKAELCGGNVAALGKGVAEGQIRWIAERVSTLYIALDRDAGKDMHRIDRIATKFGLRTLLMTPPDHREDFGDCTFTEVLDSFNDAKPMAGKLTLTIGKNLAT